MNIFNWFKKKKTNTNNDAIVDKEVASNDIYYCNSLKNLGENTVKVLAQSSSINQESRNEILDGLKFIIKEFPENFPIERISVYVHNSRSIVFSDRIQNKLSVNCPYSCVSYSFYVGVYGLGWTINSYDRMGNLRPYKDSKNRWRITDEYSIINVYEFINSVLNAMGYTSIALPIGRENFIKPKYSEMNTCSPLEELKKGKQYLYGKEENIDWERAYIHFKNSAKGGSGIGMYYLACCMLDGKGTAKDVENGKKWLLKACENDIALAYERLGQAYDFGGEFGEDKDKSNKAYQKAFALFERDYKSGDHDALHHLAMCYHYGNGVNKDVKKSVEYLKKSAEAGNDEACYELALLFSIGDGVKMDKTESFMWYKKAADLGNVDAFYNIGYCYETGVGVQMNLKNAFEWYMKGAQKEHAYSQYKVGMCFLQGIGTEKNVDNAFIFLRIAGNKGFDDARRIAEQLL